MLSYFSLFYDYPIENSFHQNIFQNLISVETIHNQDGTFRENDVIFPIFYRQV